MGIFAIIAAFCILLILTLKKVPIAAAAPVCAACIAAFSGMPFMETITGTYMEGVADFVSTIWLMVLLGTVLSKLMDVSGAAASIAQFIIGKLGLKWAIPAVIIAGGLLTYGGISAFVSCYALYPITLVIFQKANLPRYFIPGVLGAGIYTWVNMLPGNPSVTNMAAATYLNTNAAAAPMLGVAAAVLTLAFTLVYFGYETRRARAKGDGFQADRAITETLQKVETMKNEGKLPGAGLALLPLLSVMVILNLFKADISAALIAGVAVCCILFHKNIKGFKKILEDAVKEAAVTMMTAASITGIGGVIAASPGFQQIANTVLGFSGADGNPLVVFAVSIALMSGLSASATAGLTIILSALGKAFLGLGINAELMHRIGVIASIGPGSLPHSGGMVVLLSVAGISYRDGYKYLFVAAVCIPLFVLIISLLLCNAFY